MKRRKSTTIGAAESINYLMPWAEMGTLLLLVTACLLEFNSHSCFLFTGLDIKQIQERVSCPPNLRLLKANTQLIRAVTFHEGSWSSFGFICFFTKQIMWAIFLGEMGFGGYPSTTYIYFVLNQNNVLYEEALNYNKNDLDLTLKPNICNLKQLVVRRMTPGTYAGMFQENLYSMNLNLY